MVLYTYIRASFFMAAYYFIVRPHAITDLTSPLFMDGAVVSILWNKLQLRTLTSQALVAIQKAEIERVMV